jgi:hypothetical protein
LDLDFAYELKGVPAADFRGELSVAMRVSSGDDWSRTEALAEPIPFTGSTVSRRVTLDLTALTPLIDALTAQLGYDPGNYEIAIIPTVRLLGQLDGQAVDDTYAPAFNVSLNSTRLTFDPELERSEPREVEEQVEQPNTVQLLGLSIPVTALRQIGFVGAVICLVAQLGLVALVFFATGIDELGQLRARYGHMLVGVTASKLDMSQRIEVASFQDLIRIAKRDGDIILYEVPPGDERVFFVPDGQVVYTYRVSPPDIEG